MKRTRTLLGCVVAAALMAGSSGGAFGVNVWLSFEGDGATGPATDKLIGDGAQNAVVYPDSVIVADSPIFGGQSLNAPSATQTFNGLQFEGLSGDMGPQVTFAVHVRNVPAGRRKLFSNYDGQYGNAGIEWVFDSAGQNADGVATWLYVLDPASAAGAEWDVPRGAFDISADGQVHHIAATFDRGVVKIFLDGNELPGSWYQGAEPWFERFNLKGNPLRFGEDVPPTDQSSTPFLGYADDLLILDRALSQAEIQTLASQGAAAFMELSGACCLPSGSCADGTTQSSCLAQGGIWKGPDSMCANVTCELPVKACCFDNGTCSDLTENECLAQSGSWNMSASCDQNPCPPAGACCFDDGTCSDLVESVCVAQSGHWTAGATCAENPCPPGGACCYTNGVCVQLTESVCQSTRGQWNGAGSDCASITCSTFAPQIWLSFEGDPETGPAVDKLTDDGAQNAVVFNAPAPPLPAVLVTDAEAIFGTSLKNTALMSFPLPGTQNLGEKFTLAVSLKQVAPGEIHLFTNHDGGSMDQEFLVTIDAGGSIPWNPTIGIAAEWQSDPGNPSTYFLAGAPAMASWADSDTPHHVAWTFERKTVDETDGMEVKIYFDGVMVGDAFWAGVTGMPGRIGDLLYGEDYPPSVANSELVGTSDDILVLRRVLTADQIALLAASGAASLNLTEQVAGEMLYTMEGDTLPRITDKLAQIGAQDTAVPIPTPLGSIITDGLPIFGLQSLHALNSALPFNGLEFPEVRYLGAQATLAVHVREVPAGRRKLFSSYHGDYTTPVIEWVFDSGGQQADGMAMWLVVSDPVNGPPYYEFDVPSGAFNISADGQVHHIAMTYDHGDLKVYLDGSKLPGGWVGAGGAPPATMVLDLTRELRFGEDQVGTNTNNHPFLGYADDILILPQALDGAEMQYLAKFGVEALLVTLGKKYADFDNDGDVDLADFDSFQSCFTGAAVPLGDPTGACSGADFDEDGDVDQTDFGIWQLCFSGDGIHATADCTPRP
ncbi:MAG: laminin G domain-containing protein [Phycisphaerae bacterium]|nr:laminin G domain-containing protein [Phycisphaerae bacterium]